MVKKTGDPGRAGMADVDSKARRSVPRTRMWRIRPFTTRVINPLTGLFAGWLPGFAILKYRGRKTGRVYHLPINVFRRGDRYIFALTYGSDSQWVKNVLAAGGCEMRSRGRDVRLVDPELIVDPERELVPRPLRVVGRLGRVTEFVQMRAA
jgi:deazaflavin-dependent oxidoreductase (nitroreductase family)